MDISKYCYDYPRPAVSADIVVFGYNDQGISLLLIMRGQDPYKNHWALPGGFLEMGETIECCALRELFEETNIKNVKLEQLYTFSALARDPRGRVLTIAFWTIIKMNSKHIQAGDDASRAEWFNIGSLPLMAFDHLEIVNKAVENLIILFKSRIDEISERFAFLSAIDRPSFLKSLSLQLTLLKIR